MGDCAGVSTGEAQLDTDGCQLTQLLVLDTWHKCQWETGCKIIVNGSLVPSYIFYSSVVTWFSIHGSQIF